MSVQGTESTKLSFHIVYKKRCATELQNSPFLTPLPPRHPCTTGFTINNKASDPVFQPVTFSCLSVHLLFVLWHCCAGELWEKIFYKSYALQGMEPSKNKWLACFCDLRTMKSPLLHFCLHKSESRLSKLCLVICCHSSSCLLLI